MRVLLVASTDWFLFNYRFSLARECRARGHEVHMLCTTGKYMPRMQAEGFPCHVWNLSRHVAGPLRAWREIRELCRVLRSVRPDLVHFCTAKPILYGGLAMRWLGRPSAVVNAPAGLGAVFATRGLRARLARAVMRALYPLACNGRGVQNILENPDDVRDLQRWGALRADNFRVIRGTGVPSDLLRPRATVARPVPVALMAARINTFKGVRDYAGAARLLKQRGVAVRFLLAGAPDIGMFSSIPVGEVESWVREGLLEYLGHRDDMADVLQQSDIVVLPTRTREGVPRTLIEAAAMGKPLVATDVIGCREIVREGQNGLLVPVGDVTALADRIGQLATDAGLRERMGANGRQLVLAEFEESKVLAATISVYERACAQRGARAAAAAGAGS